MGRKIREMRFCELRHSLVVVLAMMVLALMSEGARAQYTSASEFTTAKGVPNLPRFDKRAVHFGFLLGFNVLDYNVYNTGLRTYENGGMARYADVTELKPGLVLGIVTDFRIRDNLSFRILPGISFGQRNLLFVDEDGEAIDDEPLKIKSTFVECPFLLKYAAKRLFNVRPYVVGGVTPRFDLAKDKQSHLRMRSLDMYADAGAGMDFYLTYFRLSVEIRCDFGLSNVYDSTLSEELEDIPYQQAISKLKSRWWGLVLYFE